MNTTFNFPTETVELPSKGYFYPEGHPLSEGTVEIKYMTAKEEDILTNQNYLQQGTVIDKLLQSLIQTKFNYDDLLVCDKNAILLAARILGYGSDYKVTYLGEEHNINLSELNEKIVDFTLFEKGKNRHKFTLPTSNTSIEFKFLTQGDENSILQEIKGYQKIDKNFTPELVIRLRKMILSVNGKEDPATINDFVENHFLARDSREFRKYIKSIQPDIDFRFYPDGGPDGGVDIPIGITFLWPDTGL